MKRFLWALIKSMQAIGEGIALFVFGILGVFLVTMPVLTIKTMGIMADVMMITSGSAYRWSADHLRRAWE